LTGCSILEGRQEQGDIIFRDSDPEKGFVLLPDSKWNRVDVRSLYCLALANKRGLSSVRDLTAEHLPLLKNIKESSCKAVGERYNISGNQLWLYFHYQPSFYHLHVHVVYSQFVPPGAGIHAGKAILLDLVISNLEKFPGYYQKTDMSFMLGEREELYPFYFENK